jgi:hypothetical protein
VDYRIYLLDGGDHISAGEFFSASNDKEAAEIAASIYEVCSDAFEGYEVWHGAVCILPNGHNRNWTVPRIEDVIEARQDNILDLEDRLQRSYACMNRSRKLLEVQARLRQQRQRAGDADPRAGR